MRKFKIFLPLIAVLITVAGVFAKKANEKIVKEHFFSVGYYQFNGDPTMTSERLDPSQYDYVGTSAPDVNSPCANGETTLCGIFTDGDGIHPTIGAAGDVHTALQNNEPLDGEVFLHN